jgi:hypothetical protein
MLLYMEHTNAAENQMHQNTKDLYGFDAPAPGFRKTGLFWYAVALVEVVAYGAWKALLKR